jgi:hypothetical protein
MPAKMSSESSEGIDLVSNSLRNLVYGSEAIVQKALALELKTRAYDEKIFYCIHGFWPDATEVHGRTETSFSTHGLKTTVILERLKALAVIEGERLSPQSIR